MKYFDVSTNQIINVKSKKKFTSGRFAVASRSGMQLSDEGSKKLYGNNYNA